MPGVRAMPRPKAQSRFGMNEPAAGPVARASHRLNLVAGVVVTLLPGLWTLLWNLVRWPAGLATLSNICLSLQLFALGLIVCAHWTTFNFCVYDPMRDWLEQYTVCAISVSLGLIVQRENLVHPAFVCAGIHVPLPRPCRDADDDLGAKLRKHAMGRADVSDLGPCE